MSAKIFTFPAGARRGFDAASTRLIEHATRSDLSDPGGAATNSWVSEEKNYNFASGGFGMNTGHFTQVVWKSSTQLGCCVARGCTGQWKTVVVCQYTPPGNFQGQFQANVLPAGGG